MSESDVKVKKSKQIAVGCLAFLNAFICAALPGGTLAFFLPTISKELALTAPQATSLSAGVMLGGAFSVFILGIILDKVSARVLMFIMTIVAAIAVIGRSWAPDYGYLYVMFVLYGICLSVLNPGGNKLVGLWFEKKYTFIMNAILIGGGALGYIVGLNTTLPITNAVGGWRNYYAVLSVVMAVIGICWLVFVREKKSRDAVLNEDVGVKDIEKDTILENIKHVLGSKRAWCCFIAESGFGSCIQVLIALTTMALVSSWKLPLQQAATLQSWANTGSLVGYFLLPQLMLRYWKKDPAWLVGSSMVVSTALWIIAITSHNVALFGPLYAIGGFLNGFGYVGPRTFIMQLPEVAGLRAGTALGAFNTIYRLASTLLLSLAGMLVLVVGSFDIALGIVFCCGFVGAAAVFLLIYFNKQEAKKAALAANAEAGKA